MRVVFPLGAGSTLINCFLSDIGSIRCPVLLLEYLQEWLDAEVYPVVLLEVTHDLGGVDGTDGNVSAWCVELVPVMVEGVEDLGGHPGGVLLGLIQVNQGGDGGVWTELHGR